MPLNEECKWSTLITKYESGKEQRRQKWSQPKRSYTVSIRGRSDTIVTQIWDFYNSREGSYDTFYFQNPNENPVTSELIGSGGTSFQLDHFPLPSGAFTVNTADTTFTETTNYTVNRATGAITFTVAPTGDLYATYNYCRIVRFEDDKLSRELFNYKLLNANVKFIEVL